MNYNLTQIPSRTNRAEKKREHGLTMIMDKGLGLRGVEDLLEMGSPFIDMVKLGWGTSYTTPILEEKIKLYNAAGIPVYFGGTLFEAFIIRKQFDDYRRLLNKYHLEYVEVSDGSIILPHHEKCGYIEELKKDFVVLSEVGSKDHENIFPPYKWIELMEAELAAGAWKVIGEARETGNVGLFRSSGEVRQGLVDEILTKISHEKIIWEAPLKAQQVYFIKLCGANVNLGNISPEEINSLETIRVGLRGDTFSHFLDKKTGC